MGPRNPSCFDERAKGEQRKHKDPEEQTARRIIKLVFRYQGKVFVATKWYRRRVTFPRARMPERKGKDAFGNAR